MRHKRSRVTAALAAALGAVTLLAVAAPAGATPEPETTDPATPTHVVGMAGGTLDMPGYEGDPVTFAVDAHGMPGDSDGSFHVAHHRPDGALFGAFDGSVDCVIREGDLSIVTGVVEHAELPGLPDVDLVGRRVGVSVRDVADGQDKIGWSWAVAGFDQELPMCTGTVPFFRTAHGDYVVSDAS